MQVVPALLRDPPSLSVNNPAPQPDTPPAASPASPAGPRPRLRQTRCCPPRSPHGDPGQDRQLRDPPGPRHPGAAPGTPAAQPRQGQQGQHRRKVLRAPMGPGRGCAQAAGAAPRLRGHRAGGREDPQPAMAPGRPVPCVQGPNPPRGLLEPGDTPGRGAARRQGYRGATAQRFPNTVKGPAVACLCLCATQGISL